MTDVWAWLPRAGVAATLGAMLLGAGMWIGGRDTGADSRLNAQEARLTVHDTEIATLEAIARDNATAISQLIQRFEGYVETRALIVQESARDRQQLNSRVASLENDRIAAARLEQRLQAIENLLRDRLPNDGPEHRR